MGLWQSIKARMTFQPFGGQQGVAVSNSLDALWWSGLYAGSNYDYRASVGNLHENPVIESCVAWVQRAFPEPVLQVVREEAKTGEENAVARHPMVSKLLRPNRYLTSRNVWERLAWDWLLTGNAYLLKTRNAAGEVLDLWPCPSYRIKPQWPPDGKTFISHYITIIQGEQTRWATEDVIHFRFGCDPQNERIGWSPWLAGLREVAALNEGANYRGAILRKPTPSHLVTRKNDPQDPTKQLTRDQTEALEAKWDAKAGGDNRGRPIFLNVPVDALRIGLSPAELDLGTMLNWDADAVCALIGLSSMVVGISSGSEHRTYANYAEAREAAFEQCIIPMQGCMAEALTLQLLPDFSQDETERVQWNYSKVRILQEDETALWTRLDAAVKVGRMSRNEARAVLGQPPIDDPSYDLPQPLLPTGFPYDQAPEWYEPPEPVLLPGQESGPESSGDAQAQAEQPGANGNGGGGGGREQPAAKSSDGHWVTIGGHPVFIGKQGETGGDGQIPGRHAVFHQINAVNDEMNGIIDRATDENRRLTKDEESRYEALDAKWREHYRDLWQKVKDDPKGIPIFRSEGTTGWGEATGGIYHSLLRDVAEIYAEGTPGGKDAVFAGRLKPDAKVYVDENNRVDGHAQAVIHRYKLQGYQAIAKPSTGEVIILDPAAVTPIRAAAKGIPLIENRAFMDPNGNGRAPVGSEA